MNLADSIFATIKSIGKAMLHSRRTTIRHDATAGRIVVMANGPSLADTIARYGDRLANMPTMAVNFAANTPQFVLLKPRYYVLADPHFFSSGDDTNLASLWAALNAVEWTMTLFVPAGRAKQCRDMLVNSHVTVASFNPVGVDGFDTISHRLYDLKIGMPRPRNVLIPSIMIAIWLGYKEIDIVGADHTWMQTLSVTDDNEVVSVQKHFYSDSADEQTRVRHEYRGYRLYQIVESFATAFRSYVEIERYARRRGVNIINCTPGSYIDAFRRSDLGNVLDA